MSLTEKQAPFTEPYALAGNPKGFRSKGPTAEAVKRALAHLGFMEWKPDGDWDQHWNRGERGRQRWKRKRGIIAAPDGSWGENAHEVMRTAWYAKGGEQLPAFDGYAQELLQNEKPRTPQAADHRAKSRDPRRDRGLLRDGDGLDEMDVLPEPGRGRVASTRRGTSLATVPARWCRRSGAARVGDRLSTCRTRRSRTGPGTATPTTTRTTTRPSAATTRSETWPTTTATSACASRPATGTRSDWWSFGSEPPSQTEAQLPHRLPQGGQATTAMRRVLYLILAPGDPRQSRVPARVLTPAAEPVDATPRRPGRSGEAAASGGTVALVLAVSPRRRASTSSVSPSSTPPSPERRRRCRRTPPRC